MSAKIDLHRCSPSDLEQVELFYKRNVQELQSPGVDIWMNRNKGHTFQITICKNV